jgi:hypothetical protein
MPVLAVAKDAGMKKCESMVSVLHATIPNMRPIGCFVNNEQLSLFESLGLKNPPKDHSDPYLMAIDLRAYRDSTSLPRGHIRLPKHEPFLMLLLVLDPDMDGFVIRWCVFPR